MLSRLLDDKHFPFHIPSLTVESSVCSQNPSFSAYPKIKKKCSRVTDFILRDVIEEKSSLFSSLRGFLSYDLTRLRVDTFMQLAYEATEIEELARSLPKIESLFLAPQSHMFGPPFGTFAFDHLCLFSRYCPNLIKFAVLVDTTQSCGTLTQDAVDPFALLQELDLGSTFAVDTLSNAAAILLARLLPTYCRFTFDRFHGPSAPTIDRLLSEARVAQEERDLSMDL
ncbi:hypothetical protein H2248_003004 [Termitomyces sp. 'cryptogamus']|nr:hypothetical protein H2248_003004 [Termitomyces sp. 'cryptogamus']